MNDRSFNNPYSVHRMKTAFDIDSFGSFIFPHKYPNSQYYDQIRIQQNKNWARTEVLEGIKLAKQGLSEKAIAKYDSVLNTDPENTDALVAKGALLFNQNLLSEAVKCFQDALKIAPNHNNAKKYLEITLDHKNSLSKKSETNETKSEPTQSSESLLKQRLKSILDQKISKKKEKQKHKKKENKHKKKKKNKL
uniref:Uncharacterized protein n=1 Tax=Arcella intermedia TaxID=1963864 RepID=A0A6B2LJD8_9EUKA